MKDFTRVCRQIGISRPSRAIDLVKKWDCQIDKRENSSDNEEPSLETLIKEENGIELLTFSEESRNSIRTSQSDDDGCILDQEESLKQEWFVKNTQYLKKVAEKGIGEFTSQINNLIETYKIDSISCEETIPEICTFK